MTQTELIQALYTLNKDKVEYGELEKEYNKLHFGITDQNIISRDQVLEVIHNKLEFRDHNTSFQSALMRCIKKGYVRKELIIRPRNKGLYPNSKRFVYTLIKDELIKDGILLK